MIGQARLLYQLVATLKGGDGTDTISMTGARAEALSANTTFAGKIEGFEKLYINDTVAAATTVNMANMDGITYVVSNGSAAVGAAATKEVITIDFASPAKPVVEPVAVDFSKAGLALCILDSGADHADLTDEYAAIPAECRAVAAVCGGEVLRDVPFETFLAKLPECRRQCGDRAVLRAFHVYADNDRVAKQVAALHDGDFDTFLCLVNESGRSSWEYLQNVIPAGYKEHQEVGVTIAAAKHLLGDKGAVRVHGGGFAGTVQAFVPVEMLDEFKAGMEAILGEGRCHVLSIRPEGGAVL